MRSRGFLLCGCSCCTWCLVVVSLDVLRGESRPFLTASFFSMSFRYRNVEFSFDPLADVANHLFLSPKFEGFDEIICLLCVCFITTQKFSVVQSNRLVNLKIFYYSG